MNTNLRAGPSANLDEAKVLWGEIAPCEHIAQFYTNDSDLLDTLTGFFQPGLNSGEAAIAIATSEHLKVLWRRLLETGIDMKRILSEDRFITLDADRTLSSFMVHDRTGDGVGNGAGDWPDEKLFGQFIHGLIRRGQRDGRRVRVFGEMVALLWERKQNAATVRLEHLWHQSCLGYGFSLLCSYPTAGFAGYPAQSLAEICAAHSRVV